MNYKIDVNTLKKNKTTELQLNEIGRIVVSTAQPLFYDPYSSNPGIGCFILIDPLTNNTMGAGIILEGSSPQNLPEDLSEEEYLKDHIEKREFAWQPGAISAWDRILRNRHQGKAVLITGVEGAGMHEVAKQLELELFSQNMQAYYLGISNIIGGLDADIGDAFWDRDEHLRRVGELARILTDAGLIFITAITNVDEYDFDKLKMLNTPNELLLITLGDSALSGQAALSLPANPDPDDCIMRILTVLSEKSIIPEYCI